MTLDELFRLMEKWGKFVGLLTAIVGAISIFVGKDIVAYILILVACFLIELWLLGILRQEEVVQAAIREGSTPPAPLYTKTQRDIAQWSIALISIFTIGLGGWLIWTYTQQTSIHVFSVRYPFTSTGISVKASDQIEITVSGQNPKWNCGRTDSVGPEGYSNEGYGDTVFDQANPCALIGSISSSSPEVYFLVGSHRTLQAAGFGTLYLGCNDSIGRFGDNPSDSSLEVEVTIVKWLNIIPTIIAFIVLILAGIALIPKFRRQVFPPNPVANLRVRVESLHGRMSEGKRQA